MRYKHGVTSMDVINMEVKIKQGNKMLDATIEMVDGVMVVSPKVVKFEPKDGDVIYIKANSENIFIYKECKDGIGKYANFSNNKYLYIDSCGIVCDKYDVEVIRPATEEERLEAFKEHFKDFSQKYSAKELFTWHHVLTGSCKQGRESFCKQHGIDLDTDMFTIHDFVELTKDSYGGGIVKRLTT